MTATPVSATPRSVHRPTSGSFEPVGRSRSFHGALHLYYQQDTSFPTRIIRKKRGRHALTPWGVLRRAGKFPPKDVPVKEAWTWALRASPSRSGGTRRPGRRRRRGGRRSA